MVPLRFGKMNHFGRDFTVYRKVWIIPCYRSFAMWSIVIVTLVLEDNLIGQDAESMSETARDEQLLVIFFRQFYSNMSAEGRRILAKIHCHIQHLSLDDSDELGLSMRRLLEMQSPDNSI